MTVSQASPRRLSFPICKMGKVGLATHNLGFSPWLTDVEAGIPEEMLKVHEVVG